MMKERKTAVSRVLGFVFADEDKLSLENRLFLTSTIIGIVISVIGSVVSVFVSESYLPILISFFLNFLLLVVYFLARFKKVFSPLITPLIVGSYLGIFAIWVFAGGIDGPNMQVALVIFVLTLLIVPQNRKRYLGLLFFGLIVVVFMIQLYWPQVIGHYHDEHTRWFDSLFTTMYSAFCAYLIIKFLHKHYTAERRRAEENEQKFRMMYDRSPDMYFSVAGKDASVVSCNETLLHNLGYTSGEVVGRPIFELYNGQDQEAARQAYQLFVDTGCMRNKEFSVLRKDGTTLHVSLNEDAVRDKRGVFLYSISSWRDVTDKKEAELRIVRQNEELRMLNADKDLFLSVLAHDLRNPMGVIHNFSELLLTNMHRYEPSKIEKQVSLINAVSHQTCRLLEDLLLWSKSQSGKLPYEPGELHFYDACREVTEEMMFMAQAKKVSLRVLEHAPLWLFADHNMMKTILRNLLTNAIKYTHEGGRVIVSAEVIGYRAVITVSDNGVGISPGVMERLWQQYKPTTTDGTAHEKGSGLGLLLCKQFVEKHGGTIWVESVPGEGSDFKFTLPVFD